jgi:hypothetical protein
MLYSFLAGQMQEAASGGYALLQLDESIERTARDSGASVVREWHIAKWLEASSPHLASLGLANIGELAVRVREIELGPGFDPTTIAERWHGSIDTTVIIQCHDLKDIKWQEEVGASQVVLWACLPLFNELDMLAYDHRKSQRVHERVRRFRKWVGTIFEKARTDSGVEIRPGVRLRIWGTDQSLGARDTDHLEAAALLHEKDVPVRIVTRDLGMRLRASLIGLPTHEISDRWWIPPVLDDVEEEVDEASEDGDVLGPGAADS